jgi:hypothetical protein
MMAGLKERDVWQYGDFQTPPELAHAVCRLLVLRGIAPMAIIEPTCGLGAFLAAAAKAFPGIRPALGIEINKVYVENARTLLGAHADVEHGDFFTIDWDSILSRSRGPWLVLGNPPWVTNAELGLLKSTNLPAKTNFQGHQGLDAITGKANFDISEWMLLSQLEWLKARSGWIAVLVKTSVARKVLRQAWRRRSPVGRAAIYRFDAMKYFGAAVDSCLFVLPVNIGKLSQDCDVFDDLTASIPATTIGFHDENLVSNVPAYLRRRDLIGLNRDYVWRSGVKHDCSKVMELSSGPDGVLVNGLGEKAKLEAAIVYPLLKSSDIAKGRTCSNKFMIVTQREIGEETSGIANQAPRTWQYLLDHADQLDARGSVIYRGKPRFSVFGVGPYAYAQWKVAISGFYKALNFTKVGPSNGRPVMLDDTIYFLPCHSEAEADFIMTIVQSEHYMELVGAMIFLDEKRPITADLLKRISLEKVAQKLCIWDQYMTFTGRQNKPELQLDLV